MQSQADVDSSQDPSWHKCNVKCPSLRLCGMWGDELCQWVTWFGSAQCKFMMLAYVKKVAEHNNNQSPMWQVFPRLVVVGNLTAITIDVWWQYDYCTLFWKMCPCLFLERCSNLYVHPFKATMAMSNIHNTQSFQRISLDALQVWPAFFITS